MHDPWALRTMQKAARLKETQQMFRQIDHLEEFRLSVEKDPEAFKRSIKCLREQFLGSKQLQLLMSETGLDVGALAQGQATCASLRVE
ncbi:unnamed protein product [Symbiodinium pilosum]|uniref:Uncharacterized protein n=1 Tax=Symbiodinium pilosum TaxID=2952 RepID=A0A812W381_SYMPI|nr:unnamed protein product [Symbiodinium pilosum]